MAIFDENFSSTIKVKSAYKLSFFYFILAIILVAINSCRTTRSLEEGEYLLTKNNIELEETSVKQRELNRYIRQTPNRKLLGFYRFHLRTYLNADRGRENRLKRWMKNTIGEPPEIYNPILAQNTVRQFELYMHSKGYFNAEVSYEEKPRRKKMRVAYHVKGNEPYIIREVVYDVKDPYLSHFIFADTLNTLIQSGKNYDADILQKERERISRDTRNKGFFDFSREFISFVVDTTLNTKQADLNILINNPVAPYPERRDTVVELRHKRYKIKKVNIFPEYSPLRPAKPFADTTLILFDDSETVKYRFLHDEPFKIKSEVIANNVSIMPGDYYNITGVDRSYQFLSGLRNFRYININFYKNDEGYDGISPSDTTGFLEARVQLSRSPARAYTIEAEGLNTAGNLGLGANLLLQNKNIFSGAEILNFRIRGAFEMAGEIDAYRVFESLPFNTFETGAELSIDFPKLLVPIAKARLSQRARPKSIIMTGINYRQRPDYTRYVINVNYSFEWSETRQKRHYVTPIEISSIRIFNDSILRQNIPDNNPLILSRFRNHLTAGLRYAFEYNTQMLGHDVDFSYLRTNFETSGNVLWLASNILGSTPDDNEQYRIFNIPFAHFVKGDADYRYYRVFDSENTLVFRVMAGLGVPYGNADVLPFVKSYYSGGANSIRAWRIYSLGPGSYQGESITSFDRYGDIKLEGNVEYRFPIYGSFHGGLFVDAGNVWFFRENPDFEGGEFLLDKFYKDIAIGGGFGLRLDFGFFVIRVDAGIPLRDPAQNIDQRWISDIPDLKLINWNLGIGYPF